MKETAKSVIMNRLADAGTALAIHEFDLNGISQNSIGTRLSELASDGLVIGTTRPGKRFKEWIPIVKPGQQELPLA